MVHASAATDTSDQGKIYSSSFNSFIHKLMLEFVEIDAIKLPAPRHLHTA
jgi:hypothetical protein